MSEPGLLEIGRAGRTLPVPDVIDMHGHLGAYSFSIPDLSPESLVRVMDRLGVRSIACGHLSCITGRITTGNRQTLAAVRAHPGRILGYVVLWPASPQAVGDEARRYLDEGFVGIKLHDTNGFAYTEEAYAPALAMAHERRLPVLLHTWGQEHQFQQVRRLAADYPQASFLLGHSGILREGQYLQIARELPNVYLETCTSLAPVGLMDRLVAAAGADKVVWGSDAYFLSMAQQIGKVLGARICDGDKVKVLSTNARAILDRIAR